MVNGPVWMETDNTYPYWNLAMEEYMALRVPQGACISYLWQNHHTMIIGKSQSCWRERRVNFSEQEDDYLMRRPLRGDVVFHNLGNSNSTFTVGAEDYDISRQLDVIPEAVRGLGIHAEKTGRDGITAEGRKFSGNAFYRTGNGRYHHGTIPIRTSKENISRYLNVSKEKFAFKGVTSVKSRVASLRELRPDITLEEIKAVLVEALSRAYRQPAVRVREEELLQPEVDVLIEKFASWQREYGKKIPLKYEMEKWFPQDNIQIRLHADEGVIQDVSVFSDTMDQEMFGVLAKQLEGCSYAEEGIYTAVEAVGPDAFQAEKHTGMDIPQSRQIKEDIKALAKESL